MTNTLHRQGPAEELSHDYVIFATTARDINRPGSAPKIQEFMRICLKHHPVNIGSGKLGNIHQEDVDIHELISQQGDGAGAAAVFTDLDILKQVVGELIQADLGLSINISGLLEGVQECCHANGIERHSVEQSLGFWGARDLLPEREILAFNSLCGHGMVSFAFIRKLIEYVKMRRLTPRQASVAMAKCCECGVFNTTRAEMLLDKLLEAPAP
jgi:hypothetical protein